MAKLVAAAATSHAFALMEPLDWDNGRENNHKAYARRFGNEPDDHPNVGQETDEDIVSRFKLVSGSQDAIRDAFKAAKLDALIIIGDDQNENFSENTYIPLLAIYTGSDFKTFDRANPVDGGTKYEVHTELAEHLYRNAVEDGFDLVGIYKLPENQLRSHAIGPVLERVVPDASIKIIPIWLECIHMPAPTPARCYAFGQALRAAIEAWPGDERIGVIASGGLSHVTAGYPYKDAPGVVYGSISADYDRENVIEPLRAGKGESFANLTTNDLLAEGLIELRCWIATAGMIGAAPTTDIVYEPFYRGIMGMGVAYWDLEKTPVAAK